MFGIRSYEFRIKAIVRQKLKQGKGEQVMVEQEKQEEG